MNVGAAPAPRLGDRPHRLHRSGRRRGHGCAPVMARIGICGVRPAGLGSRDTLRLEAGLNCMARTWTKRPRPWSRTSRGRVAFEPEDLEFIGPAALEAQRDRHRKQTDRIALDDRGVMRHGMKVAQTSSRVRSGIFAPALGYSIGLARVPRAATGEVGVLVRERERRGRIVRPPLIAKRK